MQQNLMEAVKSGLAKGQTPAQITSELAKAGHHKSDIHAVLAILTPAQPATQTKTTSAAVVAPLSEDPSHYYGQSGSELLAAHQSEHDLARHHRLMMLAFLSPVVVVVLAALGWFVYSIVNSQWPVAADTTCFSLKIPRNYTVVTFNGGQDCRLVATVKDKTGNVISVFVLIPTNKVFASDSEFDQTTLTPEVTPELNLTLKVPNTDNSIRADQINLPGAKALRRSSITQQGGGASQYTEIYLIKSDKTYQINKSDGTSFQSNSFFALFGAPKAVKYLVTRTTASLIYK